jgi:hypothetical protein
MGRFESANEILYEGYQSLGSLRWVSWLVAVVATDWMVEMLADRFE